MCLRMMVVLTLLTAQAVFAFSSSAQLSVNKNAPTKYERKQLAEQMGKARDLCLQGDLKSCRRARDLNVRLLNNESSPQAKKIWQEKAEACINTGDVEACYDWGRRQELYEQWGPASAFTRGIFEKSCTPVAAFPKGCTSLASMVYNGRGGAADKVNGRVLYQKACDEGDLAACPTIAFLFKNGEGGPLDLQQAVSYYNKACEGGLRRSCTAYAELLEKVKPVGDNANDLLAGYLLGCNYGSKGGDGYACLQAAELYAAKDGPDYNPQQAQQHYSYACAKGSEDACYETGYSLDIGKAGDPDKALALQYYTTSCSGFFKSTQEVFANLGNVNNIWKGNDKACVRLTDMLLAGEGAPQDTAAAVNISKSACEQIRSERICNKAADVQMEAVFTRHPSIDNANAVIRYEKYTCNDSSPDSTDCFNKVIGRFLTRCTFQNKDSCQLLEVLKDDTQKSCDYSFQTRVVNSCHNTGFLYEHVTSIRDLDAAKRYYTKSCSNKNAAGCSRLEDLSRGQ